MNPILNTIYIYQAGVDREQKHFNLIFHFIDEETGKHYEYDLAFMEWMPLDEFKKMMLYVSNKMGKENPVECRGEY